jgi:hypothetical protein
MAPTTHPTGFEPVSVYTREQAIADGTLVAVSEAVAREAGFRLPLALTRSVYEGCVAWTDSDTAATGVVQDQAGRLWDVVAMAALAGQHTSGDRVRFHMYRVPRSDRHIPIDDLDEDSYEALCLVSLILRCGPGDQGEPVLTIMEPGED